tara:strand:- start:8485 stop:9264 length:780 start_codon:yes stop_codon:yes gene_type:complete
MAKKELIKNRVCRICRKRGTVVRKKKKLFCNNCQNYQPDTDLIDNVRANVLFSPLYFIVLSLILNEFFYMPWGINLVYSSIFSTFFYVYCSHYFQPDLDVRKNRPGMGHFPIGRSIGAYKIGRFLKWITHPVNRVWYHLWGPFAKLFTHRGVTHWPIISVWLRIGYLLIIVNFIELITSSVFSVSLSQIIEPLEMFFPTSDKFFSKNWWLWCFPVFWSDFIHILVDYYDSVIKRGGVFCSKQLPRGILANIFNALRGKE